jgi:GAF domain-containing protein
VNFPHDTLGGRGELQRICDFKQRYAAAFDAFVANRAEATLRSAYELGREAIARELGVLDMSDVHHEALSQALHRRSDDLEPEIAVALAGEFLAESLSAFEMVQRGYREERERVLVEHRHARMLRHLSTLLSDVALTAGAGESFAEALQLVAEQARELIAADDCVARASAPESGASIEATAHAEDVETWPERSGSSAVAPAGEGHRLSVPILTLDGHEIGGLEVSKVASPLSELDEAVLVHVAQMTAAAMERARLYDRRS